MVKSNTIKEWLVFCTGVLRSDSLTSEQKFSNIFESDIFTLIKEDCNISDINHQQFSNLGSVKELCDMLDKKHSYLQSIEEGVL